MNIQNSSDPRLDIRPLGKNLAMVMGRNHGRFPLGHVFLIRDEMNALIDTGCGTELLELIRKRFRVDCVINSHGHPDHSAGNFLFPDVPLYGPEEGMDTHGNLFALSQRFFAPDRELAEQWRHWITQATGFGDRKPTHWFRDGHVFDFGLLKLTAIHTPGHTKDHYCFFDTENGTLLSFDIDLTPFGPWYGNKESDLGRFRTAVDRIRDLKPRLVATSHTEPVTESIDERFRAYAAVFDQRSEAILALISEGADLQELVAAAPIYGRFPYAAELLRSFEEHMISMHLREMEADGKVRQEGERFFRT
jgi:glyoxylase-like metal-dependent hydrolase (beta-lactamase superfamily II)